MQWFEVDKAGLSKLLARRGKSFVIVELVQNAWDENTNAVQVTLARISGSRYVTVTVEDDNPTGFVDLSHAFTLFAESAKKQDVNKRGRFNLGEKLMLALCEEAEIASTTGTVVFDAAGRHVRRLKRECGSVFTGKIRMTNEEMEECAKVMHQLIPPSGILTTFNGEVIPPRVPVATLTAILPTEIADEDGYLRRSKRKTTLEIHEPGPDEQGGLYEMGIPVVETGDRWHVNIMQKVPLNVDRDNVPPAYLALVRSVVIEATRNELTVEDANSAWIKNAIEEHGEELAAETITHLADLRFGAKRVAYDPSDPEANKLAVSKGYTVVYGNQMSRAEWDTVRRVNAIPPAGQVTPSPKPFQAGGEPLNIVSREKLTAGMQAVVAYIQRVAPKLVDGPVSVVIANDVTWAFAAVFGKGCLTLNLGRLGHKWFSERLENLEEINSLLIHELGHHYCGDHLSSEYYDALCLLGSKLTQLALQDSSLFRPPANDGP